MRRVINDSIKQNPRSLAAAVGYLFERERETNRITSIIEGVRYGLSPEEIMPHYLEWPQ
jgi:V/A-type H+-transporting ATPase subunit C